MSYCSSTLWTLQHAQLTHIYQQLTRYLLETYQSAHQLLTPVLLTIYVSIYF